VGSDWCCRCLPVTCGYFGDSFNRQNSSNLGAEWSEIIGNWSISGQNLVTSDSNALCLALTEHPEGLLNVHVRVYVRLDEAVVGDGQEVRVVVNYRDSQNYDYVQYTFCQYTTWPRGDVLCGLVRVDVYSVVSGVHELREDSSGFLYWHPDPPHNQWYSCYVDVRRVNTETRILASCSPGGYGFFPAMVEAVIPEATSSLCGVATGSISATAIRFDNFQLFRHRLDMEGCPYIFPQCGLCYSWPFGPAEAPASYIIALRDFTDDTCSDCEGLNGDYVLGDREVEYSVVGVPQTCIWKWEGSGSCCLERIELRRNTVPQTFLGVPIGTLVLWVYFRHSDDPYWPTGYMVFYNPVDDDCWPTGKIAFQNNLTSPTPLGICIPGTASFSLNA